MRLRHPRAGERGGPPPSAVSADGERVPLDDDGEFEAGEAFARRFAANYGLDLDDIRAEATCEVVKSNGEVCGRDLPCQYHSDDEGDEEEDPEGDG